MGTTHLGTRTPMRALVGCGPHVGPSLTSSSHIITYLQKKIIIALSFVFLLSTPRVSISLLNAPFLKLFQMIVAYVTLLCAQLVFCFSGLYFE